MTAGANARARLLLDARRPVEAEAMLAEGLASNPDDVEAWLLLTVSLQQQDRLPAAIQAAERACALAPDLAEAHVQRSRALCRFGRRWDACDAAAIAIRLEPDCWTGHASRAEALAEAAAARPPAHVAGNLARRRGLREAVAHAERAIALAPFQSGAWFALAIAHDLAGHRRAAAAAYRRVLALEPEEAGAANNLALLALRRGRLGPATDLLLAGVRARPAGGVWVGNLYVVLSRAILLAALALVLASGAAVLVVRVGPGLPWAYAVLGVSLAAGLVTVAGVLRRLPSAARRPYLAEFARTEDRRGVLAIFVAAFGIACTVAWLLPTAAIQHLGWLGFPSLIFISTGIGALLQSKNDN